MPKNPKQKKPDGDPRAAQLGETKAEVGLERGAPSLVAMDSPDDSQLGAEPPHRAEGQNPE